MTKRTIIQIAVPLTTFIFGCMVGRVYQHAKNGYHHEVQAHETYRFPNGKVDLTYASEYIGVAILEPETSIITLTTENELPVIVYKAQRGFQEAAPHVSDVATDSNRIDWVDGLRKFQLTITPMIKTEKAKTAEPPAAASASLGP